MSAHALVVGGTGMLRDVSLALASRGYTVSVIARKEQRLSELVKHAQKCNSHIHPINLDYRDVDALPSALEDATSRFGPIELAVNWIHSTSPDAPMKIAHTIGHPDHPCDYFHVLGSSAGDPSRPDSGRRTHFEALPNIRYFEVILGFVLTGTSSRWLTHAEISQGVLLAIEQHQPRWIVGTVEPWSASP